MSFTVSGSWPEATTAVSRCAVRSRFSCWRRARALRVSARASAAVCRTPLAAPGAAGGSTGSHTESDTYAKAASMSQSRSRLWARARPRPWRRQLTSIARSWRAPCWSSSPSASKARVAARSQSRCDQRSSLAAAVARGMEKASRRLAERRTCRSSGVRSLRVREIRAGKSWSKSAGWGWRPVRRISRNRITANRPTAYESLGNCTHRRKWPSARKSCLRESTSSQLGEAYARRSQPLSDEPQPRRNYRLRSLWRPPRRG
jgi:hypothetical protein